MAKRKLKTVVITEELGKLVSDDIATWTPEQKAAARAALQKQANLSCLRGRAGHLHGLALAAQKIASEEANFKEVMQYFEEMKSDNVKYKM
jgi:hypothetical protein